MTRRQYPRPRRNRSAERAFAVLRDVRPDALPTSRIAVALESDLAKVHMDLVELEQQGKVRRVSGMWFAVDPEERSSDIHRGRPI